MEEPEHRALQARDVYILMKKDYRISRNSRASWFFQHLNKTLQFTPQLDLVDTDEELQVASVVPNDGSMCDIGTQYNVMLMPSTMVTFVARRYRFVIILDLSPSVSSVDINSCSVLYEQVHKSLANFLRGLVPPFKLPFSSAVLTPEIHITVLAHTPVKSFTFNQVLAQGLMITEENVESIISSLALKLDEFESTLATGFASFLERTTTNFASSYFDVRPSTSSPMSSQHMQKDSQMTNDSETGIVNMIRNGMLALQLLPENSSAGLVVITDGCLGVPDANLFEFLLTQLRTSTISCSFLRIGERRSPFGHFGHVPHNELMQFIATATFGSYFDSCPDVVNVPEKTADYKLNIYHKAMFLWSFQKGLEGFRFDLGDQHMTMHQSSPTMHVQRLLSHPISGKLANVMSSVHKRHSENNLNTSAFSVLSVRLREGYTIREIAITKGESELEVRLVLPWREYARFEYLIRADWPLDKARSLTHTEITIEGSYDFLHDMTCTKLSTRKMSSFRSANVKKFWLALQGLSQTDQLLVHLQSFTTNAVNYTVPDILKKQLPLFYLPLPNSTTPALNTQLNAKDIALNQFASFWRPVAHLDIKVWQKWMHTHRIGLILEHDQPLHKNIHYPNSSSRFTIVMFRQALTSLSLFLAEWSTFVLLDGQSYIKLVYENKDESNPPVSFVLVCMTPKSPCLVLRLAFLGGTPGYLRYQIVNELKQKVAKLKFPKRGPERDKRRSALMKQQEEHVVKRRTPLKREWSEIYCCVLLRKPVESILIRYERTPRDMTKLEDQGTQEISQFLPYQVQQKNKTAANMFNSLARYLLHRRWIWTVQQAGVNSISMQGIGRILSTLAKMRLQQGFHFSLSSQGIVNLVVETDVQDQSSGLDNSQVEQEPSCVVQYVIFPPHMKITSDSLSDDEEEMEGTEEDGELQIITECWVEPQHGICVNNPDERKQFEGLTCYQIPDTFLPLDLECISSLITLEHLLYLCQNCVIPVDLDSIVNNSVTCVGSVAETAPSIQHVAFPFNLLKLLPKCQQAELVYSAYTSDIEAGGEENTGRDANHLLYNLLLEELCSLNQRNVTLSHDQSKHFMHQLHSRPRATDINPFPFLIDNFIPLDDESEAKQTNQSELPRENASFELAHQLSKDNTSKVQDGKNEKEAKKEPKWRCFIKSISHSSLLITLVPASFDDVMLMNASDNVPSNENPESEPESRCDSEQKPSNVSSDMTQSSQSDDTQVTVISATDRCNTTYEQSHYNQSTESTTTDNEAHDGNARPQNIDIEPAKDSSSPEVYKIPIYIYDCITQHVLDSLIFPWDFQLNPDIHQDKTFKFTCDSEEVDQPSPRSMKRVSFSVDSLKDGSETMHYRRTSWRSQERRSTEGSNEDAENLLQQIDVMSETFNHCYVKGVFQSLQKGYTIVCQDIDAAINNICEESFPIEVNMTTFLHASCTHFQHIVNEARKDEERETDQNGSVGDITCTQQSESTQTQSDGTRSKAELPRSHSVRFMDIMDSREGESHVERSLIPNVLEIPRATLTFDIASLNFDIVCEPIKDLHQLVKDKFLDIVQKWFRPVQSSPEYYYYCPENSQETEDVSDGKETSDNATGSGTTGGTTLAEAQTTSSTTVADSLNAQVSRDDHISNASVLDSEESMEDDVDLDLDMTLDDKSDQTPLFINFTCTVKSRLQQHSVPLKNIAVCLGELASILSHMSEVELADLKITFDLNCLTLPTDVDLSSPQRPLVQRMYSSSSMGNQSSCSSDDNETIDRSSVSHVDMTHLKDVLGHLPQRQHDAVTKCMEEIKWLLQDEIVSNLRHISPIKTDALTFTAKHIQTSSGLGKANVSVDNIPLQFVFGQETSSDKFTEEFQKMNLENYQLVKERDWYYLSKKRLLSTFNANNLCFVLDELHQWKTQSPASSKVCSPASASKSELSDHPDGREGKAHRNLSPLVLNSREKAFDITSEAVGRVSPLTVKSEGHVSTEHRRSSREKRASTDGIALEGISLLNRRRSNEFALKMRGSHESINTVERRRSHDVPDDLHLSSAGTTAVTSATGMSTTVAGTSLANTSADKTSREHVQDTETHRDLAGVTQLADVTQSAVVSSASTETGTIDSPSSTVSMCSVGSQVTSTVQSPVVSDVSIQLTKSDGRCEAFRSSPERTLHSNDIDNDSFDSEDMKNEGVLKRCSSFAGFRSEESCTTIKNDEQYDCPTNFPEKGTYSVAIPGVHGRLRHCSAPLSGQGTPRSKVSSLQYTPSCISSRGSLTEDGAYDGDMSEMDDSATTFSESGVIRRRMPNFWLIMHINANTVEILFQHRETGKETNEESKELRMLLSLVKLKVEKTCCRVNQQLLLNDLYTTRMCHTLLVDAADEDLSWKLDTGPRFNKTRLNISSSENEDDDDDDDRYERKYLAVAMELDPGHFDCDCVWTTQFYIHPGLKRGARGSSTLSIGIKTLRSVLNRLSVNNRNNMFVTKETETGNVFYLRLNEVAGNQRPGVTPDECGDSLSSSRGLLQAPDTPGATDKDLDSVSIGSSSSAFSLALSGGRAPTNDRVELTVHGIDQAGKEIKEDLVQLLQKKLDEAVLEKICEMLRRNPQCQLERDDVQFIQKRSSEPTSRLHLTISNKASPQLAAVMYYLRQNLLLFLHPPKYKTLHDDSQFVDVLDGKLGPIPADQAFLYIPSHTARKTGIAVISVCLVDGQGNQVKLLQCPRPSGAAYMDIENKDDIEAFVVTHSYEIKPHSKKPGPTALIQFHVWEVGEIDIPTLHEKLTLTLKHALCDVVMEYHLLTAPLCTIPKHMMDLFSPAPNMSAPTSPFFSMQGEEFRERKMSMVQLRKLESQQANSRRSSLQNQTKLQALRDVVLQTKKRVTSPSPDTSKSSFEIPKTDSCPGSRMGSPAPERHPLESPRVEPVSLLCQYENGEAGTLHRIYSDLIEDWFKFCASLEVPSVSSLSLDLYSRFSVDYTLQEFKNVVTRLCPTLSTRVYKMYQTEEEEGNTNVGTLYVPNRSPFESGRRKSETSLDLSRPVTVIPGQDRNFMCVCRDLEQWNKFVQHGPDDEDKGFDSTASTAKGKLITQKFAAHIPSSSEGKTFGMFQESSSLIPRQKFLLMNMKNKQLQVYTYNWSKEALGNLTKQMTKLTKWNNTRIHLLSNVVIQKCGLFNHYLYGDISNSIEKITQQTDTLDQLINNIAPPPPSKEKLTRSQSVSSVRETYLPFDMTFKDLYPSKPLHLSYLACHTDQVKQTGQQAQDIRIDYKQQFDKVNNIRNLYVMWVQKTAPNYPIAENIMRTLKQASRLFHYCATPLLFSSTWRQHVLEKFKVTRQDSVSSMSSTATPDTKSRSRHGSGTSTNSLRSTRRTDSQDLKKRSPMETAGSEDVSMDEEWHLELRSCFICQYIKYLQTIGFHYVQMERSMVKGKAKKRFMKNNDDIAHFEEIEIKATETHNLQKTVSGGVLLIELSFRDEYFCVKLHTCDHNKLGITVNQQLKLLFVDECEKCKDLIHVHSFAHDFHLRCIQTYIGGHQEILKPSYYLSGLLKDFAQVYPYAPGFSRNCLQKEVVTIPEPSCSSQDLYDYMLKHAKLHAMSVLKMQIPTDTDASLEHQISNRGGCEYALICHEVRQVDFNITKGHKKNENYNIGVIILQDNDDSTIPFVPSATSLSSQGAVAMGAESGHGGAGLGHGGAGPVLRLQFYLVLTSSQMMFPRQTLDKDRALILTRSRYSGDTAGILPGMIADFKNLIAVKKSVSLREESTNYLGYSNKHQYHMYKLLQEEATLVRDKIENMAVVSMDKCRRDTLWNRLLVNPADEVGPRKRGDSDDKNPLKRLTYEEFKEMLERVHRVPLYEIDQRLIPFLHMNLAWYQGLAQVLSNKYPENMKRFFTNPDNNVEQHCIILNPNFLDLFMMLYIDNHGGKTGLYAVFRKPAKEQESICPGGQNLPEQCVHNHMEQFINTCCFHLWSSML